MAPPTGKGRVVGKDFNLEVLIMSCYGMCVGWEGLNWQLGDTQRRIYEGAEGLAGHC